MQNRDRLAPRLVGGEVDIVVLRVGPAKTEDSVRPEPMLGHNPVQQSARIVIPRTCGRAAFFAILTGGEFSRQLPGRKKRRPIDVIDQLVDRVIAQNLRSEKAWFWRLVGAGPVELERIGAGSGKRQAGFVFLGTRMR